MAKKSNKKTFSTGDKVFTTLALALVLTLTYKFTFASTTQQQGTVLGDEKSGVSTVSTKSTSSDSDSGKSTNDSQSTKTDTETSTQKSTSNSNKNEVSTQNKYTNTNQIQVKTQNAGTETNLQVKTETSAKNGDERSTNNKGTEFLTDTIELSTEEFSTINNDNEASTETSTELSTSINLVELEEEFGEPVTAKKTTKLEKLFLLIPVEIETDEIVNQEGVTIAEKQSMLGRLLDFFSF